jgi:hypothetical protein
MISAAEVEGSESVDDPGLDKWWEYPSDDDDDEKINIDSVKPRVRIREIPPPDDTTAGARGSAGGNTNPPCDNLRATHLSPKRPGVVAKERRRSWTGEMMKNARENVKLFIDT